MTAQLSPLRTGRITGSRIAAVLGISPYATADDVLRGMIRDAHGAEAEFGGNRATEWGHEHEPDAIREYEDERWVDVHGGQEIVLHPDYPDLLAVTPDGLIGDAGMIEVKCPYRAQYVTLPEHYRPQVMLQLACTGRAWCDFVIWRQGEPLLIERVPADPEWLPTHLSALVAFHAEYESIAATPERCAPFLEPAERSDAEWSQAAAEFHNADAELDAAGKRLDSAKAQLRELAGERSAKGCGVSISRIVRSGSVDWKAVVEKYAPDDVDLDEFRKESATVWTIR